MNIKSYVPYQLDVNDQAASDLLVAVNTSGATALDGTVPLAFTHAMAKVVVNLTFRNQWTATPTVSTVSVENAAIRASVNLLAKTVAPVEATRQKVELPAVTANTRYASIIIPQGQVSRVAVGIDGKDYVYQHSEDICFEAGKVTTINLIVGRDRVELGSVTIAHPHAIDLGLPSGTMWACCNMGAKSPTEYGGYYAWGETEEKSYYGWNTYAYCDGSQTTCHNIGSDIAGTQYDVAHVKWGSTWRMPAIEQFEELNTACTWTWKEAGNHFAATTGTDRAYGLSVRAVCK